MGQVSSTQATEEPSPTSARTVASLKLDIERHAERYFAANPGRDGLGTNVSVHGGILQTRMGNKVVKEHSQHLLEVIIHRLNQMTDADEYVSAMGITFPSCHGYEVYPPGYVFDPATERKWEIAWDLLIKAKLFPSHMVYVWISFLF